VRYYINQLQAAFTDDEDFDQVVRRLALDREVPARQVRRIATAFTGSAPEPRQDRCQLLRFIEDYQRDWAHR
jgi:hypothetical protein